MTFGIQRGLGNQMRNVLGSILSSKEHSGVKNIHTWNLETKLSGKKDLKET